jgi:methylmalonyl-CoA/ethylmalonyl-CoA epimerase
MNVPLTIGLTQVDHLGIAVRSMEAALPLFVDLFGARFVIGGDDPVYGMRTIQFELPGGMKLELMAPLRDDCHLHAYFAERGEGFHHLTVFVRDLEQALEALAARGIEVVDTDLSDPKWRVTYIRPSSGFGTLIQVAETSERWDVPVEGITLEACLAGEVVWYEERPVLRSQLPPGVVPDL